MQESNVQMPFFKTLLTIGAAQPAKDFFGNGLDCSRGNFFVSKSIQITEKQGKRPAWHWILGSGIQTKLFCPAHRHPIHFGFVVKTQHMQQPMHHNPV